MGEARVYLGSRSGAATSPIWSVQGTQIGEELGTPVAGAGDVNGDGYADVIVGAASHDGPLPGAGLAMVFLGSAAGVGTSPAWSYSVSQTNARFGTSVASAGDLNADGYSDILVGASGLDFGGRTDAGAAYVFLGAPTGPAPGVSTSVVGAANGFTLGTRVSTAGDVNGDGYSDILVTAGGYNSLAGRSYLYYGNGGPGVPLVPGQHRTAGALPIVPLLASDEPDRFGLSLVGRTPFGRGKVRLEYEVKTLTTLLNGSSTILSDPADTTVAGVALNATSTGLLPGVVYHWRSRLRYSAVTSPLALRSRWLTQPWNSQQEADLRIRGEAGEVPPGSLRIQKLNTFMMKLSWEPSCKSGDFDYAIYEGRIGSWYSHNSLICSTAGTLWQDINYNTPRLHLGDHYFLVVPIGTAAEGSYGRDSHGNEIPAGGRVCNVQEAVACP
jgi:hypothetical protein